MSKLGLVFAGGGGKGSYQIGAWKGLRLLGIEDKIEAVAGTSIGALNGVMFVQKDYSVGEKVWLNSSQEKMLPIDEKIIMRNMVYLKISEKNMDAVIQWASTLREEGTVISKDGLLDTINDSLDYEKIKSSKVPCYVCCTELPELKAKYFKINDYDSKTIKDILCATTALPMIFGSEDIEGKVYMDGGLKDNVPIQPLYDIGCDIIIVMYFNKYARVDKSLYPNAKIIEILPSKDLGGWLVGTLDFSRQTSLDRILQGYKDVLRLFKGVMDDPNRDIVETIEKNYDKINENLEEMIQEKETIEDGIKKLRQIKVIRSNVRTITKNRKRLLQKVK